MDPSSPKFTAKDKSMDDTNSRQTRRLTLYRDDSTVQVHYERVKTFFWTAGNTVLVIARYDQECGNAHHYIHWPRERVCWFRDEVERE
jgi:hypothetical protein